MLGHSRPSDCDSRGPGDGTHDSSKLALVERRTGAGVHIQTGRSTLLTLGGEDHSSVGPVPRGSVAAAAANSTLRWLAWDKDSETSEYVT